MGKKIDIDASFNNAFTSQKERYDNLCQARKHPRSTIVDAIIMTIDKRIRGKRMLARMTEAEAVIVNNDLKRLEEAIDVFDESTR